MQCRISVESAVFNYTAAADAEMEGDIDKEDMWGVQKNLGVSKKNFQAIEEVCVKAVLLNAEVIVSTCIGAGVRSSSFFSSHICLSHSCLHTSICFCYCSRRVMC
jgi:hypothetical protein